MIPFLKKVYTHDPVFENAKVIYSMHEENYSQHFNDRFIEIASIMDLQPEDMAPYQQDGKIKLINGAITYSDAIVKGSEDLDAEDMSAWDDSEKPKLDFFSDDEFIFGFTIHQEKRDIICRRSWSALVCDCLSVFVCALTCMCFARFTGMMQVPLSTIDTDSYAYYMIHTSLHTMRYDTHISCILCDMIHISHS